MLFIVTMLVESKGTIQTTFIYMDGILKRLLYEYLCQPKFQRVKLARCCGYVYITKSTSKSYIDLHGASRSL